MIWGYLVHRELWMLEMYTIYKQELNKDDLLGTQKYYSSWASATTENFQTPNFQKEQKQEKYQKLLIFVF